MTIPVYSLFEYIILEPMPAILGFCVFMPAFCLVWNVLFGLLAHGPEPEGFIGVWCYSARFLLFCLALGFSFWHFADTVLYAPDPKGLAIFRILDKTTDRDIIVTCGKRLRVRSTDTKPQVVWFETFTIGSCIRKEEEKKLFGHTYPPPKQSLNDFFQSQQQIPKKLP